jgi:hypothetical protein
MHTEIAQHSHLKEPAPPARQPGFRFLDYNTPIFISNESLRGSLMEKFLLIPPVDKSLPPLRTGQWIFLLASFLVTLAIFIIFLLTFPHSGIIAAICAFAAGITIIPMLAYAQNSNGRIVLIVFEMIVLGGCLWAYRDARDTQDISSALLIIAGVGWLTWCIDKVGNAIMERLNALQRRINSVESKLDHMERTGRKEKSETEKIPAE